MKMTYPQRIAAGSIEHLLGEGEQRMCIADKAKVYLSWRPEAYLKIKADDDAILVPIPKWPQPTEREIFTAEGFMELADRALRQTPYYIGYITFIGYAGFFRYPQIRGRLYRSWKPEIMK